jgi:uncharacterized protein (DUF1697 family)
MSARTTFIVLFRGVGGKTQLPMARLRQKLTEAGFENVATYINSGNAVVTTDRPRAKATAEVATICREAFGFDKDIHFVTRAEWDELINRNPFPEAVQTPSLLHAVVLAGKPDARRVEALRDLAIDGDGFEIVGGVAYLHTPRGFSKSKLAERFDKGIDVPNTGRNWNTVLKLAEIASRVPD